MSGLFSSHGLVVATAMAVSAGTLVLLDLLRDKHSPRGNQILKSCLSSGNKKNEGKGKKKKVHFADDVKDSSGNGEEYRKKHKKISRFHAISCGSDVLGVQKMPANRAALYSGMLKDRLQKMEYSF